MPWAPSRRQSEAAAYFAEEVDAGARRKVDDDLVVGPLPDQVQQQAELLVALAQHVVIGQAVGARQIGPPARAVRPCSCGAEEAAVSSAYCDGVRCASLDLTRSTLTVTRTALRRPARTRSVTASDIVAENKP